jgi:hypothetical protein
MAVTKETTIKRYIGLSTDTKPTHTRFLAGTDSSDPEIGSTYYEYDTGEMWITYDGDNWLVKGSIVSAGKLAKISSTKKIPTSNAYAVANVVSDSETNATAWSWVNVVQTNGGSGEIALATIVSQATNVVPRLVIDLYVGTPTSAVNDHVASTGLVWADTTNYLGTISGVALENVGTGSSHAMMSPSTYGGLPIPFNCTSASRTIYGIVATRDAWTPVANNSVTIALTIRQLS